MSCGVINHWELLHTCCSSSFLNFALRVSDMLRRLLGCPELPAGIAASPTAPCVPAAAPCGGEAAPFWAR